ncbi:MAG: DNA translocase FtsK 4TM domain-containing protein, partial [Acidimicrobiales bacterium]
MALALLAFGVILGLGLYTGTTGIIGRGLTTASGAIFGLARYLVPLCLLAGGWMVLRSKKRTRRKPAPLSDRAMNAAPWVAVFIAGFCILDLIGGRPHWQSPVEELSGAGGWTGVWLGGTIERYLGLVGEIAVTVVLMISAAILLTSMSLGTAADSLADRVGMLFATLRGARPGRLRLG